MELTIIQLTLMAVVGVVAAMICKKYQMEFSAIISMGICLLLMFFMVQAIDELIAFINQLAGVMNLQYIGILLKLIGIAYVCEFASGLCKDAGYQAISGQIEMAGRVAMMVLTIPIMQSIIQTIEQFLSG